ncbi:MAG: flagellar protein FlaG [Gammaproteobacteria bacterium]
MSSQIIIGSGVNQQGPVFVSENSEAAVAAPPIEGPAVSLPDIDQVVSTLNELSRKFSRNLEFRVEKDLGIVVISVLDSNTKEVVREIPEAAAIDLARKLQQGEQALFSQYV